MIYADTLKIFENLRESFEEKEAKVIASAIENALESNNDTLLGKVATKEDIVKLQAATKEDIANLKAEIIKWMFIFWIGQFASIVGVLTAILFAFLKP